MGSARINPKKSSRRQFTFSPTITICIFVLAAADTTTTTVSTIAFPRVHFIQLLDVDFTEW